MRFDPIDFLERAVRTPSHNEVTGMRDLLVETLRSAGGESSPADARVSASADACESASDDADVAVEIDEADLAVAVDDAGNVVARRDADREGPHVVLNTHLDTVPPHVPVSREGGGAGESDVIRDEGDATDGESDVIRDEGDVIRGRGACDAKGSLAAMLAAFLGVELERGRVTLAVTPDEETDSTGAAALAVGDRRPNLGSDPDAVIVGEPTDLDVCTAAKGRFQATVTVRGASAHAAEPGAGANAVRAAGALLAALASFDDRDDRPGASDLLGAPTLVPTTVEGGTATNRVPAECAFVVDRRPVPPETAGGFRDALERHLRAHAPTGVEVEVTLAERETPFLSAFETPADAPVVRALRDAGAGEVRPFGAATEASYFADLAPTVVFGPGALADDEGAVAHAPREYVRASAVERAARVLETALADLCG